VEQTVAAVALSDVKPWPTEKLALVFGNELNGVSDAVVASCDGCLVVPQHGSKHSLNVSVCAGVVLWWFVQP
jgi:tRNA G18 (ribose-2'-O)-methylase SpoU